MTLANLLTIEEFKNLWIFTIGDKQIDLSYYGEICYNMYQDEDIVNSNISTRFKATVQPYLLDLAWFIMKYEQLLNTTTMANITTITKTNTNTGSGSNNQNVGYTGYDVTNQNGSFQNTGNSYSTTENNNHTETKNDSNLNDIREWLGQEIENKISIIYSIFTKKCLINIW